MRKILFFLLSSLLCWQLSALDGPKDQSTKPPGYLSFFMPVYDSTAFPVCVANVKARLKDTLVCVNVVAVNFDTIAALQYTVKFDTSIVQLKQIKLDTALKKLTLDDFSVKPSGLVSLVYSKPESAAGLSIRDSTRLYQLCFKPLKLGATAIAFNDTIVAAEVLGPKGSKRPFKGESGRVEIINCRDTMLTINVPACKVTDGGKTDTLRLKTVGGCDSIVIKITKRDPSLIDTVVKATFCVGDTFKFGTKLLFTSGVYYDTLAAAGGCDSIVQLILGAAQVPLNIVGDSSVCVGKTTLVRVSGGKTYIWSTGATTDTVRLGPGTYTVTVRDSLGACVGSQTFTIDTFPPAPVADSSRIFVCSTADIPVLKVKVRTGLTANWFTVPTGGTPVARDTNAFKPTTVDTFYVEAIDSVQGCSNPKRTQIIVQFDTLSSKFTSCPAEIKKSIPFGQNKAVVTWDKPSIDDKCGTVKVSSNFSPGDTLPVGTTKVRYIIADSSSNTIFDSCVFNVVLETSDSLTFYVDTLGVAYTDSTINVPIKVRNFKNVQGFQYTLCVPADQANIVGFSADTAALKGLDNFAFSSSVRTVNWFDAQSNGVTLKDSTTIFTLRIKALKVDRECILVQFKNKPSDIIATKTNLTEIVPTTLDGKVCPPSLVAIKGKIFRENKVPVKFVTVDISPDTLASVTTGTTGEYAFLDLPYNQDHVVRPSLDSNHSGGVNILDVVLIQRHILAKDTFDTPYQWIAADVNRSKSITVADILNIRRLILGALTKFPDNTSWRFVPEGFKFPDVKTTNPLSVAFPDSILFKAQKKDSLNANFIGIKVGDVNLSTSAQLRADETMEILIANRAFDYGEKLVVDVRASDLGKYAGYQFDLGFDRETLEFVGVEAGDVPGVDRNAFNLNEIAEGRIPTLWYQTGAALRSADNPVLFKLSFNTLKSGEVAAALWLNQQILPSMAVNQAGQAQHLKARFTETALKVDLGKRNAIKALGVQPNPFKEQAMIRFKMPLDSRTTLSIIDATGREVYREARNLSAGVQEWTIDGNTLGQNGVYHYRILTAYGVLTDKVILTK